MAAAEHKENSGVSLSYPRCLKDYAGIAPSCQKVQALFYNLKKAFFFAFIEKRHNVVHGISDRIDLMDINRDVVVEQSCVDLICTGGCGRNHNLRCMEKITMLKFQGNEFLFIRVNSESTVVTRIGIPLPGQTGLNFFMRQNNASILSFRGTN